MIEPNEFFIEDYDTNWFSVYEDGYLAHFASNGSKAVPALVINHLQHHEEITDFICDYFFGLEEKYQVEIIEENIPKYYTSDDDRSGYAQSFFEMAARGIFSYDFNDNTNCYLLVARPLTGKKADEVPREILDLIHHLPNGVQSSEKIIEIE